MGTGSASSAPGTITRSGVTEPSILSPGGTNKTKDVPPTVDVPPGTDVSVAPAPEPGTEPAPVEGPRSMHPPGADRQHGNSAGRSACCTERRHL